MTILSLYPTQDTHKTKGVYDIFNQPATHSTRN
jgi:hypothetical protein